MYFPFRLYLIVLNFLVSEALSAQDAFALSVPLAPLLLWHLCSFKFLNINKFMRIKNHKTLKIYFPDLKF